MLLRQRAWRIALCALAAPGCPSESLPTDDCAKGLKINEVAAANEALDLGTPTLCETHLLGWCCEQPDWVELYNDSEADIELGGYWMTVTLDEPKRAFPETTLQGHGRLVLVATPYVPDEDPLCDADIDFDYVFAGIDLDRDGVAPVVLRSPLGQVCDDIFYPDQHADASWARWPDGAADWLFGRPSPGDTNKPFPDGE